MAYKDDKRVLDVVSDALSAAQNVIKAAKKELRLSSANGVTGRLPKAYTLPTQPKKRGRPRKVV